MCQPVTSLISHAATFPPVRERVIRGRAEVNDWSGHPKTKRQGVVIIISIDEAFRVNAIAPGPAAGLQNGWRLRTGGVFIR